MTCHTFYEGSILHQVNWIWILDLGIQLLQLQFWGYPQRDRFLECPLLVHRKKNWRFKTPPFPTKKWQIRKYLINHLVVVWKMILFDQDHYNRLVFKFFNLVSFQVKETSSDTRSVWNLIVHWTKLYHGTGYCYHFSLTKLYKKWCGEHLKWVSILVLMS